MYNHKFYINFKDLISKKYPLWEKYLCELIYKSNFYIILDNTLSDKDLKNKLEIFPNFFKNNSLDKFVREIDFNNEINYFFDFGNITSEIDQIKTKTNNIGFIGFGDHFNETIDYFREINCKLIVTEILPNELPYDITQENLDFFSQNYYFLPPCPGKFKIEVSKEKKFVLFIDSKNNESNVVYKNIYSAITKSTDTDVIDVSATDGHPERIFATSVITYLLNPQYQLAIRYASPLAVNEIDGKDSMKNPLRDMFIKKSNFNFDHLFQKRNSSIRYQLKSLFENDPQTSVDNKPTFSFEDESVKLINKISTCHSNTPKIIRSPYKVALKRKIPNKTTLPTWLIHFATEPFLFEILTSNISKESNLNISFNKNFYDFAKTAYYLVHVLDHEHLYSSNFFTFFGNPVEETINEFKAIAHKSCGLSKGNLVQFSGLELRLAYKYIRNTFYDAFIIKNDLIDNNSFEILLNLIKSCNEFKSNNLSAKMSLIMLFAVGNRQEEAIQLCENQTSQEISNILYVLHSLCLALQGKIDSSKQAMSNFRLLDSQYAKDYVSVAFLLAKALVFDLHDKESKSVILSYANRKPSQDWWGDDLIYLALAKVIPSDTSSELREMCKEHLLKYNIISENKFNEIHLSTNDHDDKALAKLLSFLQFPN